MDTFVGDTIKITLETEVDLSSFDDLYIKYRKPDLTTGRWEATQCPVSDTCMYYTVDGTEIDISGDWAVQAYVTNTSQAFNGKWAQFKVLDPIHTPEPTTLAPTTV